MKICLLDRLWIWGLQRNQQLLRSMAEGIASEIMRHSAERIADLEDRIAALEHKAEQAVKAEEEANMLPGHTPWTRRRAERLDRHFNAHQIVDGGRKILEEKNR